jgi:hypothetical protein
VREGFDRQLIWCVLKRKRSRAIIAAAPAEDSDEDPAPDPPFSILKYRAANDNTECAWLRWMWLVLAFSVPVSLAVALLRIAVG